MLRKVSQSFRSLTWSRQLKQHRKHARSKLKNYTVVWIKTASQGRLPRRKESCLALQNTSLSFWKAESIERDLHQLSTKSKRKEAFPIDMLSLITECTMQQWPIGLCVFLCQASKNPLKQRKLNAASPSSLRFKVPQAQLQILALSALLCFTFFDKNPCTGMLAISCARNLFCCIGLSVDRSFPLYPGCHNTEMCRWANVQRLQDFLSCSWRLMTMICIAILSTIEHIQTLKRYGHYGAPCSGPHCTLAISSTPLGA